MFQTKVGFPERASVARGGGREQDHNVDGVTQVLTIAVSLGVIVMLPTGNRGKFANVTNCGLEKC